ncbi:MAG: CoA pyrophosphatase [Proteobacteria bacterium]|nr:CoA pyrophosphatase [Pseudomonadota bacterium]
MTGDRSVSLSSQFMFEQLRKHLPCADMVWSGEGLQAAVLVALTDEREPRVILGRRAGHLRLHPGEIAFPGGKREPTDLSPWSTALREAHEEIGLESGAVQRLGELAMRVTRSNFQVYPRVAKIPATVNIVADPTEFDSVFMLPLAVFARKETYTLEKMSDERGSIMVPHYRINDDNIWGVTAAILVQLANLALDAGLAVAPLGQPYTVSIDSPREN